MKLLRLDTVAVIIVTVMLCNSCEGCGTVYESTFLDITNVLCEFSRTDGGSFIKCEGSCASSAKYNMSTSTSGSVTDSNAMATCTGVQNCCKESGKETFTNLQVHFGAIYPQYNPNYASDCAAKLTGLSITTPTGCSCLPCRSTATPPTSEVNNERNLEASSCKV
jgi:hypothetical protein